MTRKPQSPGKETVPGMPRWVKAFGIAVLLVVLVIIVLHLTGNSFGNHNLTR